eukprot:7865480-Pyramimonas_sp.AAC.1
MVPGQKSDADHIVGVLTGLGYHARALALEACDFGSPVRRARMVLVGIKIGRRRVFNVSGQSLEIDGLSEDST